MPFVNPHHYGIPPSRKKEIMTYKSGLRHAIFTVPKDRYIGEWRVDKKEGKGALLSRTGKLYEGDWERGYRHGFGILSHQLPNLTFETDYIGEWVNGRREGYGIAYYPDGSYYEGMWKAGKRHGHGRMFYADGSFYEGQWARDKYHGIGIFVQVNGNRYEGEWYKGLKEGRGIFYHLDNGQKQQGAWENGIAKCTTMIDIFYRQSGRPSTHYPIQKIELLDPEGVFIEQENSVLDRVEHMKPADFESAIRSLRIIVWADQVVEWDPTPI